MSSFSQTLRTIRYLKPRQFFYRIVYALKKKLPQNNKRFLGNQSSRRFPNTNGIHFLPTPISHSPPASFTFLNITHSFTNRINWNHGQYGKLWTYNLNYFDYLMQPALNKEQGLNLVHQYLDDIPGLKDGLEPYPISLRIMNWVKFCLLHSIDNDRINSAIHCHTKHLSKNPEYHLLANHLLENAFALCFGGFYSGDPVLISKGSRLLKRELKEQILPDGGHYERSPMYHQILLGRLLELLKMLRHNSPQPDWHDFARSIATKMVAWLNSMLFSHQYLPLFNDTVFGIAPDSRQIFSLAKDLGLPVKDLPLKESGFRKLKDKNWKLAADVGSIAPSYQPGHAHAGTFSFELYFDGKPLIVNTGTSTYQPGERRSLERSTASHNTVGINGKNSSEVWASHRVGRRARVSILTDEPSKFEAVHDGYRTLGIKLKRSFEQQNEAINITDEVISKKRDYKALAHLHFHPDLSIKHEGNTLIINNRIRIRFEGNNSVRLVDYLYAPEFNKLLPAKACEVEFKGKLTTRIQV